MLESWLAGWEEIPPGSIGMPEHLIELGLLEKNKSGPLICSFKELHVGMYPVRRAEAAPGPELGEIDEITGAPEI